MKKNLFNLIVFTVPFSTCIIFHHASRAHLSLLEYFTMLSVILKYYPFFA